MTTLIKNYQACWYPQSDSGFFYFTYFNGERKRTTNVDAANFSIVLDILRNENPVYGNHETCEVITQTEDVGEGES